MAFSNDRWQLLAANNVMRMFAYDAGSDNVTSSNYFASKWNDLRPDDMIIVSTDGALTNYRVSTIGAHSVSVEAIGGGGGGGGDGAQWHASAGAPSNGTGANGDWYLNTSNGDVYGPKAGGVWGGAVGNLKGADGDPGDPGSPGEPGDPGEPGAAGVGVPTGGATGQVLAKKSGDDHDTEWVDPPEGGEGGGPIDTDDITDAGAVGKLLMKAETESDGLDALGIEEGDEEFTFGLVFADAEEAADGTYRLVINMRQPFTINSLSHLRNTRTAGVVAVKISGTDVTSLTNLAPGATLTTTNATAANTGDAGDEVSIVISGGSDMTGFVGQINGTWG